MRETIITCDKCSTVLSKHKLIENDDGNYGKQLHIKIRESNHSPKVSFDKTYELCNECFKVMTDQALSFITDVLEVGKGETKC